MVSAGQPTASQAAALNRFIACELIGRPLEIRSSLTRGAIGEFGGLTRGEIKTSNSTVYTVSGKRRSHSISGHNFEKN